MARLIGVLVGLVFLGYQVFRIIRARPETLEQTKPLVVRDPAPQVSVLVAAWNASQEVANFIEGFKRLSYPNKELVICAGGTDGTWEKAIEFSSQEIIVLRQDPGEGKQRALAKTFKNSHGDILYLTDVDCRINDDSLMARMMPLLDGSANVVTGPYRPLAEQVGHPFVAMQWAAQSAATPRSMQVTRGLVGANTALRRELALDADGFNFDAPTGTDYTLAKKLLARSHTLFFQPGAPIPTAYPVTLKAYVRQQMRWIRNVAVIGRRYHEWGEVRASTKTMLQPWILLICAGLGFWLWEFWAVGGLFVLQAWSNRLIYLRRNNDTIGFHWVIGHYLGDMWAAMAATWSVARHTTSW